MADSIVYNSDQFDIGSGILSDIQTEMKNYGDTLSDNIGDAVQDLYDMKINIESLIDTSGLTSAFEDSTYRFAEIGQLAANENGICIQYNNGELDSLASGYGYDSATYSSLLLSQNIDYVYPGVGQRLFATAGMAVFKAAEGFLEFFEDIGDCFLCLGSWICKAVGADAASEKLADWAATTWAQNLVENNAAFEWIDKNSYFDKDSTYANIFKFAGKTGAAIVTGQVIGKAATSLQTANKISNAKKVSSLIDKGVTFGSSWGSSTSKSLSVGDTINAAAVVGVIQAAKNTAIGKVTGAGASKIADTVTSDVVTETVSEVLSSKASASAAKSATSQIASELTGDVSEQVAKEVATDITETVTNSVVHEASEEVVETISKETAEQVADSTSKKVVNTIVKKGTNKAENDALDEVIDSKVDSEIENNFGDKEEEYQSPRDKVVNAIGGYEIEQQN